MIKAHEKILVIDDEPGMCRLLKAILGSAGYQVSAQQNSSEALETLKRESFDVVITDVRMPKVNGVEILEAVKAKSPDTPVIMITAFGTLESAVRAMKIGAADYVAKPFKNDEIKIAIENVLEKQRLLTENRRLKKELAERYSFGEIIGMSSPMQGVFQTISQVARTDSTALIHGESGTGKELAARAVHFNSSRAEKPFMAIHCGALPETLLESELFGYVRGAFTDAQRDRKGLLESADGGTVFLDEVGEMPISMQVKFLRFLQEREVRPLGSSISIAVDIRIVAATNKDLKKEVERGKFREDLYYRLAVIPLFLPPLRERKEDIPLLIEHFLKKYSKISGQEPPSFTKEALNELVNHLWPGNVRELENAVEHAIALSKSSSLGVEVLPFASNSSPVIHESLPENHSFREAKQHVIDSFEKAFLTNLLKRTKGNVSRAAELSDMDRKNLQELLKKHGISREEPTESSR